MHLTLAECPDGSVAKFLKGRSWHTYRRVALWTSHGRAINVYAHDLLVVDGRPVGHLDFDWVSMADRAYALVLSDFHAERCG